MAMRRESGVLLLGLGLATLAWGCDEGGRGSGVAGLGQGAGGEYEPTVSQIQDSFDRVLSDAAAHVGNEANWEVPPDPGSDSDSGGDDSADDGDSAGDSAGDGGSTCAGQCGGPAADESCYCDDECAGNGDCCGDYAQQCGGDSQDSGDSGEDDGSGGEGGDASGTCSGFCGGPGSGGACYCDAECAGNGDCCGDFDAQCPGEDTPAAATCVGFCDGQGSDGSCYCDDTCADNGDCCDDYAASCGAALVAEQEFDLAGALGPQAGVADACWAVLADPIDVQEIAQAAGAVGLAAGGTCVAIAVVPAGATAGPTLGLSVGAAALACGGVAIEGVAVGAVGTLVKQKLPAMAQCSGEIVNSIVRVFPWGKGESKVQVQVYEQKPSNCDPDRQSFLQNNVNTTCKDSGQRRCVSTNVCETLAAKMQTAAKCIEAREQVNNECFGGGDDGHNKAVEQEKNLHSTCLEFSTNLGC